MIKYRVFLTMMVVLWLSPNLVQAAGSAEIYGKVLDLFGQGLPEAHISLSNCAYEATTNLKGEYRIRYVPGEFTIIITKPGYTGYQFKHNISVSTEVPAKQAWLLPDPEQEGFYFYSTERLSKLRSVTLQFKLEKIKAWIEPLLGGEIAGYQCWLYVAKDDISSSNTATMISIKGGKEKICFIARGSLTYGTVYQLDPKSVLHLFDRNKEKQDALVMQYEDGDLFYNNDPRYPPKKLIYCKMVQPIRTKIRDDLSLMTIELPEGVYLWEESSFNLRSDTYAGKPGAPFKDGWLFIVTRNYAKDVERYRKAAEQGEANAQNSLGFMYNNGQGVPKDYAKAVEWYQKAAEQNNIYAFNSLAWLYATCADSNFRNGPKAVEYAQKAISVVTDDWTFLDILAAAYARNGEFDKAIEAAQRSIGLLVQDARVVVVENKEKFLQEAKDRLELYRKHEAYVHHPNKGDEIAAK